MGTLRLATRGSPLALRQTELVSELLRRAHPGPRRRAGRRAHAGRSRRDVAARPDRGPGRLRHRGGGGRGRRAGRRRRALGQGHALGDAGRASCWVRCRARADPRDGLVGADAGRPAGGWPGGHRARRGGRAQLAALRPDLVFTDLRGNMARRVAVAEEGKVSAVVVAVAAMDRLGWEGKVSDVLDPVDVLPQAGQGCDRRAVPGRRRRAPGSCWPPSTTTPSHRALRSERAVLATLGGNCTLPVGAFAEPEGPAGTLRVSGLLASGDGHTVIRVTRQRRRPRGGGCRGGAGPARRGRRGHRGFRRPGGTRRRDRLPGRRRPGRSRAPDPPGRRAVGPGRRRPARSPGQPRRPRPGAVVRPRHRRGQGPRHAPQEVRGARRRSPGCSSSTGGRPRSWSASRAATPSSSAGAERRWRRWRRPASPGRWCPG